MILFALTAFSGFAQNNSSTKITSSIGQLPKNFLTKFDETNFSPAEESAINAYINSISPKVSYYTFDSGRLYVDIAQGFTIFDLMEGLKEKGISLVFYSGKEMHFVNDALKIETWSVK